MLCRDFNILGKLQIWSTASEEKVNGNIVKFQHFQLGEQIIVPQSFDRSWNDELLSHKSGSGFASGVRNIVDKYSQEIRLLNAAFSNNQIQLKKYSAKLRLSEKYSLIALGMTKCSHIIEGQAVQSQV